MTNKQKLDDIAGKVMPILKDVGVTRSSFFGSYVRGEETADSDIDILVELPQGIGLFGFARLKRKLEQTLKKKVDLLTYNSIHPLLKKRILKEELRFL